MFFKLLESTYSDVTVQDQFVPTLMVMLRRKLLLGHYTVFFCYNCAHPNIIPVSAVPTMTAVPLVHSRNPVLPVSAAATRDLSFSYAGLDHPSPYRCTCCAARASSLIISCSFGTHPSKFHQCPASWRLSQILPLLGLPPFYTSPTVGPDGPWYVITQGAAPLASSRGGKLLFSLI